jgi:lysyl-tRNA synthetase class 2
MPMDEQLLAALAEGLPACAGVALGVDRLLMQMLRLPRIDAALPFTL